MVSGTFRLCLLFIALTLFGLLQSGCTAETLVFTSGKSSTISGQLKISSGNTASLKTDLSKACLPTTAFLHSLDSNGQKLEPALAESPIDSEGRYSFNAKALSLKISDMPSMIVAKDCSDSIFQRPVTGAKNQDLSKGSTLISFVRNTNKKNRFFDVLANSPQTLDALLNEIPPVDSYDEALEKIKTSEVASSLFNQLFGEEVTLLSNSAPEIWIESLPSTAQEGAPLNISVSAKHWLSSYSAAYLWKMDGVTIGTSRVLTIDIIAPVTTISNATTHEFVFQAEDAGGTIAISLCQLDSGAFEVCTSPKTYSDLNEAAHTFAVKALDTAGNESSVKAFSFQIDLTAPNLSLTDKPTALTRELAAEFSFTATDSGGGSVVSYRCSFDGGTFESCLSPYLGFANEGTHSFAVKALDSAGNTSDPVVHTWIVDLTGPEAIFLSTPASLTNKSADEFSFQAQDSGGATVAGFECSLDGAPFSSCTSPHQVAILTSGTHTFALRSVDTLGNVGNTITYE